MNDPIVVDDGDDDDDDGTVAITHVQMTEEGAYTWEKQYERTWDALQEDESGILVQLDKDEQRARRRRVLLESQTLSAIRRGMIRFMYVVMDISQALNDTDMKPSRAIVMSNTAQAFVREFFDQNPISQMGVIATHNGMAERLTELSGNPSRHVQAIKDHSTPGGYPSLQNALELALLSLSQIPNYGTREVLVLYGSLTTCDPGDIHSTIDKLSAETVRCSVVGIGAELHILSLLADRTNGLYRVATSEEHYRELVHHHAPPLPTVSSSKSDAAFIHMGFPQRRAGDYPSLCVCHKKLNYGGYFCPRCKSKLCELPADCPTCSLALVSSPHLARSYHHLFPVPLFTEKPSSNYDPNVRCFGCGKTIPPSTSIFLECPRCKAVFCAECDAFIHEGVHHCPGCECRG